MDKSSTADLISAVVLVIVGVMFAAGSFQYGISSDQETVGPGALPFVAGLLLALLGAVIALQAVFSSRWAPQSVEEEPSHYADQSVGTRSYQQSADDTEARDSAAEQGSRRTIATIFGLMLIAILLAPVLGFLPSFGLLVFVLVTFVEKKSLLHGLGLTLGASAVIWAIFILFLDIPLPSGIFGFLTG